MRSRVERLADIAEEANKASKETEDIAVARLCLLVAKLAMEVAKACPER